jgi:hypothetical protein
MKYNIKFFEYFDYQVDGLFSLDTDGEDVYTYAGNTLREGLTNVPGWMYNLHVLNHKPTLAGGMQ